MAAPAGAPLPVTTSVEEARGLAGAGRHVILVVDPESAEDLGEEWDGDRGAARDQGGDGSADGGADGGGGSGPGPRGRIHVFVGRASNPSDASAVAEMAAEIGARVGVRRGVPSEVPSEVPSGG